MFADLNSAGREKKPYFMSSLKEFLQLYRFLNQTWEKAVSTVESMPMTLKEFKIIYLK